MRSAALSVSGSYHTVVLIYLALLLISMSFCEKKVSVNKEPFSNSPATVARAVEYLGRYGYLPLSNGAASSLRSESELQSAVATMQRFGGLTPTGRLDAETIRLMEARRCGVPDILGLSDAAARIRRYAIQGQKWPGTNLTWSVKTDDKSGGSDMVRSQLRRAFEVWSEASALSFSEMPAGISHVGADIVVSFLKGPHGDGYPFDGEGSVLAHAFFPGEGIGGDAHFDAEEKWTPTEPEEDDGVNLFAVAAHEIGHSLGLSHSSTPGSLMFPYYQVLGNHFKLPQDDREGIKHLYGIKNPDLEPTMPTLSPTTEKTEVQTTKRTRIPTTATTKRFSTRPDKPTTFRPTLQPSSTSAPTMNTTAPDICNSSIDAISVIRREIFAFKGNHFWRLDMNRTLRNGYPVSIDRFWHDFPFNISKIDAVYERPQDTKIVFFSGKNFWLFSANHLDPGYPKPLTDLGLPENLDHVDAAMVWGHNGKTYLFSGKQYWKFDETEGRVELDYPRNISAWRGVPQNIDAAFQWIDGNTYFFKQDKYWKFVDTKMKVEKKGPSEVGGYWFKCPSKTIGHTTYITPTQESVITFRTDFEYSSTAASHFLPCFYSLSVVYFGLLVLIYHSAGFL